MSMSDREIAGMTMSDKEVADLLRSAIIESAQPYLKAITDAQRLGFQVSIVMGPNNTGDVIIQQLVIAKHF